MTLYVAAKVWNKCEPAGKTISGRWVIGSRDVHRYQQENNIFWGSDLVTSLSDSWWFESYSFVKGVETVMVDTNQWLGQR